MSGVDYAILGIIGLSGLVSLVRGFVREVMSLVVWACAFGAAWFLFQDLAPHLTPWIATPSLRLGTAFAILLLGVLLVGGLTTWVIGQLVNRTGLTGTDRFLGALFGVARGMLLISILVLLAGLAELPQDPWWKESRLIGHFQSLAVWLLSMLPPDVASYFRFLHQT